MSTPQILYCHCAYAKVVPPEVKDQVLQQLIASGRAFDAVADLCEMSAKGDPALAQISSQPALKIAACYPRAVKWLFSSAGVKLPQNAAVGNRIPDVIQTAGMHQSAMERPQPVPSA